MSGRSFAFLVNPHSGGGAAPGAVVPVARLLREAGAEVEVTYSPGPKATVGLVRDAVERGAVVVAVGGDGMLSSVAGEVSARDGELGIVPAGRGNDFARMVGLPTDSEEIARVLLDGEAREVDLLGLSSTDGPARVVAGSVYAGVDARAAQVVDRVRWLPRRLQYPYAAVRSLATFRPADYRVAVDGAERSFDAATVVVANSGYYGSGMRIAPGARIDDGLLDVVVIEAAGRLDMIRSFPKVYDGAHVALDQVHVFQGRRVELEVTRGRMPVGGDGEPLGVLRPGVRLRVELRAGALRLVG